MVQPNWNLVVYKYVMEVMVNSYILKQSNCNVIHYIFKQEISNRNSLQFSAMCNTLCKTHKIQHRMFILIVQITDSHLFFLLKLVFN